MVQNNSANSSGKLSGKTALVTGGNSGIGLATAQLFEAEGAQVILTASTDRSYAKAAAELGTRFEVVQTDVAKESDLDRLFATIKSNYGNLDVVVANAGVAFFRPTEASDAAFFDQLFKINVHGVYFTVAKALPLLNPRSSVILTGSSSSIKGMPGASVYSATKAAIRSFARTWTAEIPVERARFNVLSPGPIDTPIFEKMGLSKEQADAMTRQIIPQIPARRIGSAEEMAKVCLFLATDDSSFVMGAEIFADGGLSQI